ncbi:DNA polymerase Y family protein [Dactylosporangium siamense]|uniref:DNA polymerase n=1 Tax=Dactylosporangium siamense TaxID=685454 RepID=A0A919PX62_9ACTN|nr:DNA polymerase Y family protein [Dactylosporangium siamense]GIG50886.1 DNA polymerase [Dactylosporangium siamense]
MTVRTIVVWCPDWPVVAAEIVDGYPAGEPVAVLHANRVLATSPAARAEGVRRGLRKREAQGRCPHLIVLDHDPGRDMRAFEPVLVAVEELAPGVETLRPGACALAARGPARYYGGEAAAAERIVEQIAQRCDVEAQVGIAEGTFAAGLAARAGVLVPPGETAAFLADLSITALGRPALADLLRRLGIHTLKEFAALPGPDVLARFGFDAALAHRLAGGRDERPLAPRRPPVDLDVTETFDEPVERVDAAAFAARALAERLHERLQDNGLACTRLGIEATTVTGQELLRTWRHDGLLSVAAIADRLRWQLDGWLQRNAGGNHSIVRLRLVPEGVVEHLGLQPGLWGEAGDERDRAHRALTRVQGLLGPDAVLTAVLDGGRADSSRIRLVAFGDERVAQGTEAPWPGRLPAPSPATVYPRPLPAEVTDKDGQVVRVSGRLELSGAPKNIKIQDKEPVDIVAWAGPWPVDERWWDEEGARRRARFQLQLADERAILAVIEDGGWHVEALYD